MIFSAGSFLLMSCGFVIIIFQCFICAHVQLISFTLWSISNWVVGCPYTLKFIVFHSTCRYDLLFSFHSGGKVISWLQWENHFNFCHIAIFPREISGTVYELEVESKQFLSKEPKSIVCLVNSVRLSSCIYFEWLSAMRIFPKPNSTPLIMLV